MPAGAYGLAGRADAPRTLLAKVRLHDAILQRVKRDHGDPASGAQYVDCGAQPGLKRSKLIIYEDA